MEVYDGSCAQCDEQMKDWVAFIYKVTNFTITKGEICVIYSSLCHSRDTERQF